MRFRFKQSDSTVEAGFHRIANETLDETLALLRDRALPSGLIVHRVRRSCKAMRGLLRLVRPVFPAYEIENAAFRDVAASLSAARDSVVLVDALESLVGQAESSRRYQAALKPHAVAAIRADLAKPAIDPALIEVHLEEAAEVLLAARVRAAGWSCLAHGDPPLAPGLRRTYRAARRRMTELAASGDPQLSHQWRKQVKYHWQHMRLLRSLAPDLARARAQSAKRLGDLLGEQHDFDLLAQRLAEGGGAGKPEDEAAKAIAQLARHRAACLAERCAKLGTRLFDQKSAAYMMVWDDVWERWPKL